MKVIKVTLVIHKVNMFSKNIMLKLKFNLVAWKQMELKIP